MARGWWLWFAGLLIGGLLFIGCRRQPQGAPPGVFVPPPVQPVTAAVGAVTATPSADHFPTPTPPCQDALTYLEDLTIPDGTVVAPGEALDKQWKVRNSGTCNWDERYRLRLVDGVPLGAEKELPLYPARAGAEAVIRILFTAPEKPGLYISTWQAVNPAGQYFGDPIYIQIRVNASP